MIRMLGCTSALMLTSYAWVIELYTPSRPGMTTPSKFIPLNPTASFAALRTRSPDCAAFAAQRAIRGSSGRLNPDCGLARRNAPILHPGYGATQLHYGLMIDDAVTLGGDRHPFNGSDCRGIAAAAHLSMPGQRWHEGSN